MHSEVLERFCYFKSHKKIFSFKRSHGVMVTTLDSESKDPSSSLGGTSLR